jgi:hypothetical protein
MGKCIEVAADQHSCDSMQLNYKYYSYESFIWAKTLWSPHKWHLRSLVATCSLLYALHVGVNIGLILQDSKKGVCTVSHVAPRVISIFKNLLYIQEVEFWYRRTFRALALSRSTLAQLQISVFVPKSPYGHTWIENEGWFGRVFGSKMALWGIYKWVPATSSSWILI